jgi:hypothetical protein
MLPVSGGQQAKTIYLGMRNRTSDRITVSRKRSSAVEAGAGNINISAVVRSTHPNSNELWLRIPFFRWLTLRESCDDIFLNHPADQMTNSAL